MADYPCDMHGARYEGPSNRVYLRAYRNDQMLEVKLSVCDKDLDVLLEPWTNQCLAKTAEGYWTYLKDIEDLEPLWKASGDAIKPLNGSPRW